MSIIDVLQSSIRYTYDQDKYDIIIILLECYRSKLSMIDKYGHILDTCMQSVL